MVVGACRERAQHALERLCAQTPSDALEIVVVDLAPAGFAALSIPSGAAVTIVPASGLEHWGEARRLGLERTSAPVVAFVEEHCFTEPGWAAALIEAHQGPWASVGYAFRNANPESYVSRAAMITDYGLWLDPVPRGRVTWLAGNNVSYKREAFLSLGDRLESALATDFIAHQTFRERGLPMFVEPGALAKHMNFTTVHETAFTNYVWCRAMAARRAAATGWSPVRRVAQALVTPATAPLYRVARLARTLRGRRALWPQVAASLPVLLAVSLCAGVGEAAGYLMGAGNAEAQLKRWELDVERAPVT
ncbi:MAG TPA: glycosyltransferase family A protein [Bryobacteraceae bacterium]|nr:glycosyltransferase family A protein [Bryobacteraceae bacterium]